MTDTAGLDAFDIPPFPRILRQKERILAAARHFSVEQALIIDESYRGSTGLPKIERRALALAAALEKISIGIDEDELIVGNRTRGIRDGVVSPESGISWIKRELDTLPKREQDPFLVGEEDRRAFLERILPAWETESLEHYVYSGIGEELGRFGRVFKINQKDHAQGHIIPDAATWLRLGPEGLRGRNREAAAAARPEARSFHRAVDCVLEAASRFMVRYADLAAEQAEAQSVPDARRRELGEISAVCRAVSARPPETFREALQALWFLFVVLQMESNASSFSPGRADQYLLPYYRADIAAGRLVREGALELIEALYLCFNGIVYMRNCDGARYFAGFPIGFNITLGGTLRPEGSADGSPQADGVNELSYLFLAAQAHLGLPQPNLSARLHRQAPDAYVDACVRVIGLGSGMPQIVNDQSIVPALERSGIPPEEARDYGLVGCVELSTQGNYLGWSDAAMFNLAKVLELTLNGGVCLLSGDTLGPDSATLEDYPDFPSLMAAYKAQTAYFVERMMGAVKFVDRAHAAMVPSPFLSSVVSDCIGRGIDVTAGGARFNLSGIQAIQPANVADSLAAIKLLVYDEKRVAAGELLAALRADWAGHEKHRQLCVNRVPKYGNDVPWVDALGAEVVTHFADLLGAYTNARGGRYQMGLYTVSAHVPMGSNVGAGADGRRARSPLADGGVSPTYGRDLAGPTAVLKSVSALDFSRAGNGSLLNMKFVPSFFTREEDRRKFGLFLRAFVRTGIHHIQFNVVNKQDLLDAQEHPEKHRNLTIRVAGYTAYFTELARELQNEIIERSAHGAEQ